MKFATIIGILLVVGLVLWMLAENGYVTFGFWNLPSDYLDWTIDCEDWGKMLVLIALILGLGSFFCNVMDVIPEGETIARLGMAILYPLSILSGFQVCKYFMEAD